MKVGLTTLDAAAMALFLVSVQTTRASAKVCYVSTESNPTDRGRTCFVKSPGDPCSCSEVRLGGHNTVPVPRPNPPVYLDNLSVLSGDGVRSWPGCPREEPTTPTSAPQPLHADCQEIMDSGQTSSGVYTINHAGQEMQVFCSMESGKGYIVFQRRINGSVSFNRTWQEYTDGFGDPRGEFWMGNGKLRSLTEPPEETWELVVSMTSFDGQIARASYGDFQISGDDYTLDLDVYDGSSIPGDSLMSTHQKKFTTLDQDNDESGPVNCAVKFKGGWWYKKCNALDSNLNGLYYNASSVEEYMGLQWVSWKGEFVSLKSCEMKIRCNPSGTD